MTEFRKQRILLSMVLWVALASCNTSNDESGVAADPPAPVDNSLNYTSWDIAELSDSLAQSGAKQIVFMDETAMQGIYMELLQGDIEQRSINSFDEVYYIYAGNGTLMIDGSAVNIEPGQIIFTKAGMNARFEEVTKALQLVLVTMKTIPNSSAPTSRVFAKTEIETPRNSDSNVWNPFIQLPNVIMGLYMLPERSGGDQRLVHSFEELNIVVSGTCKFKMDTDEIDVGQGSIVFVKDGNGHFFRSLSDDTDVLILWEQP